MPFSDRDRLAKLIALLLKKGLVPGAGPEATVRPANDHEDFNLATDAVIEQVGQTDIRIAYRTRKGGSDFTLRRWSQWHNTEWSKIQNDGPHLYIVDWGKHSQGKKLRTDMILVDVRKMLELGFFAEPLVNEWKLVNNGDGTGFAAIPITKLNEAGCLVFAWDLAARKHWYTGEPIK